MVLTEPTDWIGGQITQQAVPTDDHRWIESCGCTRSYRELRQRIRHYYRQHYPLTDKAKADPRLNPGGPGPVSPLAHEPKVCLAVVLKPANRTLPQSPDRPTCRPSHGAARSTTWSTRTTRFPSDITIINWPQNDYLLGNPFGGTPAENARHLEGARQLSLSLLYWLQTEAPRPDGKLGWRGLRLRGDSLGTEDGLAKLPYIRESRRILAELTILEQHVRQPAEQRVGSHQVAPPYADSVGVGSYGMDLHPTTGGDNWRLRAIEWIGCSLKFKTEAEKCLHRS